MADKQKAGDYVKRSGNHGGQGSKSEKAVAQRSGTGNHGGGSSTKVTKSEKAGAPVHKASGNRGFMKEVDSESIKVTANAHGLTIDSESLKVTENGHGLTVDVKKVEITYNK